MQALARVLHLCGKQQAATRPLVIRAGNHPWSPARLKCEMPTPTTVRSFAKVNLGLRIGPARPDGFHSLTTLYQTIALHDELVVSAERAVRTTITLSSNDVRLPTDGRNTVYRMAAAALEAMHLQATVHIHLQKNLPVQGGLGAGSANAAAALLGLERQLGHALSGPERLVLAERIGSDVPLFLVGGAVYGHDRGQLVMPYPDLPATPCVIAAPGVGSSTPQAFRAWDARIAQLTVAAAGDRLSELSRIYADAAVTAGQSEDGASGAFRAHDPEGSATEGLAGNPLPALVHTGMDNDFEDLVFEQHPFLRDIKRALQGEESVPAEQQAITASLSGSGSSLFGLYRNWADARAAQARAEAIRGKAFLTETLPRQAYWRTLFVEAPAG